MNHRSPVIADRLSIFLPNLAAGGSERVALNLCRGLADRGADVDLVVGVERGPYRGDVPDTVRVVDLGAARVRNAIPRLARYLRNERPRAMLSLMYHANVAAVVAHRRARVETRLIISDRANISAVLAILPLPTRAFWRFAIRWAYPRADGIIEVSQGVADDLHSHARVDGSRVFVIYNPTIAPDLVDRGRQSTGCGWFDNPDVPVLLGSGRLHSQKDFPTLIEAVARVRRERHVRLVILGEGRERPTLEQLVENAGLSADVAMPGFVANPFAFVARSSAFVLSSIYEGLPNALIEAMPFELPLIATDCESGPREILEGGRHGRLVPMRDVEALAQAIRDALDGHIAPPEPNSWHRFTLDAATEQYHRVLLGDRVTG